MSSSKGVLTKELGDLLGFDDGAEDVLEHLLSIESSEDLLDYLSQLLGQDGEAVKSFVENVEKFQRGENLVQTNGGSQQQPKLQLAPRQSQDSYTTGKAPVKAKNAWQDNAKKQQGRGNKQQPKKPTVPAAKKLAAPAAQVNKPPPVAKKTPPVAVATKQPVESKKKVAAPKLPPEKSHPKKGKASHVCGCFGTIHKPLANCLYCGRVSCYNEGFDFCAFCGLMVEKVDVEAPKEGAKNKAWLHKERLLRFDRDFAKRTVVLDDQEDYYANATSTWLTEDERVDAQDQEEERRKNMHDRKKQTLSLAI